jgi:hypothetical protein
MTGSYETIKTAAYGARMGMNSGLTTGNQCRDFLNFLKNKEKN